MAMNKAEREEVERLRLNIAKARALRWPDYTPEVLPRSVATGRLGVVPAWTFNTFGCSVSQGCFNSVNHSKTDPKKTSTQGRGGPWYPTQRDALMALRLAKTDEFAVVLASLDQQIANLSQPSNT